MERTLVLIKPDAIERGLIGEIIKRFEKKEFKISAMKLVKVNRELAEKHYQATKEQLEGMGRKTLESSKREDVEKIFGTTNPLEIGKKLREWLIDFLSEKEVIAMIIEGESVIEKVRKIVGHTNPIKAEKGTIRGDFGIDSIEKANMEKRCVKNLVHASSSKEEAEREIKVWFENEEL
ncbi:MAG: nucleoside-diphosphate kinase [Candidatus Aenigmarchaeota archaeon]|nr:nucleoside-diphosphate kinase [Candidatus Aenigmarchaeota archaeon]MDW8149428.1 nucleoside-diphosphate kinase [Candidatus Aenigmarchaeota archaeon]